MPRHGIELLIVYPPMVHKYSVGQLVYFEGKFGQASAGHYEIVRVLPVERDNRLNYRIKSTAEAFERTVEEHELKIVGSI